MEYPEDEEPTQPGKPKVDQELMQLLKWWSCFSNVERRRFLRMTKDWYHSPTDSQVLLEETAKVFSGPEVTIR